MVLYVALAMMPLKQFMLCVCVCVCVCVWVGVGSPAKLAVGDV